MIVNIQELAQFGRILTYLFKNIFPDYRYRNKSTPALCWYQQKTNNPKIASTIVLASYILHHHTEDLYHLQNVLLHPSHRLLHHGDGPAVVDP